MRNFEDRMAEIDRRSKERIRARQHRHKIIGLCIPLVLCLWAGAAVLAVQPGEEAIDYPEATHMPTETLVPLTDVTLTVTGNGQHRVYEDRETVERVVRILNNATESNGDANISKADLEPQVTVGEPGREAATVVLRIVVSGEDGAEKSYLLAGLELRDETESRAYVLTEKQVDDLLKIVGR